MRTRRPGLAIAAFSLGLPTAFGSVAVHGVASEAPTLGVTAGLWGLGLTGGIVGAWASAGHAPQRISMVAALLAIASTRTTYDLFLHALGYGPLVVFTGATGLALKWFLTAIGRANEDFTTTRVDWSSTDDPRFPCVADVDGKRWRLRLNDGTEHSNHTLFVDDAEVLDLDEWPPLWQRRG